MYKNDDRYFYDDEEVLVLINKYFDQVAVDLREHPYTKVAEMKDILLEMTFNVKMFDNIEDIDEILDSLALNEKIKYFSKNGKKYIAPTKNKLDELFVKICFGNWAYENVSHDTLSRDDFLDAIQQYNYYYSRKFQPDELDQLYLTYIGIKCQRVLVRDR